MVGNESVSQAYAGMKELTQLCVMWPRAIAIAYWIPRAAPDSEPPADRKRGPRSIPPPAPAPGQSFGPWPRIGGPGRPARCGGWGACPLPARDPPDSRQVEEGEEGLRTRRRPPSPSLVPVLRAVGFRMGWSRSMANVRLVDSGVRFPFVDKIQSQTSQTQNTNLNGRQISAQSSMSKPEHI